jgi:hypothetical protein
MRDTARENEKGPPVASPWKKFRGHDWRYNSPVPTDSKETYERYRWLIEPLKAAVPDLEFIAEDYGDTCLLSSRALDKSLPLTLPSMEGNPSYDLLTRWQIAEGDHQQAIDRVLKVFTRKH